MRYWNYCKVCPCLGFPDVELGTAPQEGDHHGRLAVEQTYGYMFHNVVAYGILTTVNAIAFLHRQRGGKLNLTRLIPATRTNPTMLCLLYYISYLCASTPPLIETHCDGRRSLVFAPQPILPSLPLFHSLPSPETLLSNPSTPRSTTSISAFPITRLSPHCFCPTFHAQMQGRDT